MAETSVCIRRWAAMGETKQEDPVAQIVSRLFDRKLALNEHELCDALRICRRTAHKLRERGKLGFYRTGRKVTYGPQHVLNYLRGSEVGSTTWGYDSAF